MKMFRISLEGKTYEVAIEEMETAGSAPAVAPVAVAPAPAPVSAPAAPMAAPPPVAAGAGNVPSPMAGVVFKVLVKPGEKVELNQKILVLEAMKMESPIYSPVAGTVQSVLVKEGDAVAEGQGLAVIG